MRRLIVMVIVCSFIAFNAFSQQGTSVQGTVTDAEKRPLSNVTVYEKNNSKNATSTDGNGNFLITTSDVSKAVLVFSYVGYLRKELALASVGSGREINIVLEQDLRGVEEVVVVGYGQQNKITLTGAVSTISGADINQSPSASLQNNLMGRLPGFLSQQTGGRPGDDAALFQIRGITTLGTTTQATAPLIIVDDVEFTYSQLSQIDPNEIETLSLLKDASTTAVYGVRGANGVLIIRTRRGQTGKPSFSVSNESGITLNTEVFENNSAYETLSLLREYSYNIGVDPEVQYPRFFAGDNFENYTSGEDPYNYPYVNWWDELMKPFSYMNTSSFNVTGGSEKARYNVTVGYYTQGGVFKNFSEDQGYNSDYFANRYTFRSNLDFDPTPSTKVRFDISGRFQTVNGPYEIGWNDGGSTFQYLWNGQLSAFGYPVYNENGTFGGPAPGIATQVNPVANLMMSGYDRSQTNNISAVMELKQKLDFITSGLSFRGLVSYASDYVYTSNLRRAANTVATFYYDALTGSYMPATANNLYRTGPLSRTGGLLSYGSLLSTQFSLNYEKALGDHHVSGMLMLNDNTTNTSDDDDDLTALDPYSVRGVTGRFNYDYANKYMVEFSAGYNGSTRFGEGNRYQLFPAVSAGWNVDREPFFENIAIIDALKVRASYGFTGSDGGTGGVYSFEQVYVPGSGDGYNFGEVSAGNVAGTLEPRLPNDVTWEVQRDMNVGLDLSMAGGAIKFTGDYFYRYRSDILINRVSVPSTIGVTLPQVNLGEVSNRGFEFEATYADRSANGWAWSVSALATYTKNRIEFMDEGVQRYPWLGNTGRSTGGVFGYVTDGYLGTIEEVYSAPRLASQVPMETMLVGDLRYVDLNGDGIIDLNDQTYLGSTYAPLVTGLTLRVSYKGIDLTTLIQGRFGGIMQVNRGVLSYATPDRNSTPYNLGRWTPILGDEAATPVLGGSTLGAVTDFWMYSSDYLRWKMIELGYTIPSSLIERVKIKNLRIYCNGYNMALLYTGLPVPIDPETLTNTGSNYPQQRLFNLGVRFGF